MLDPSTSEGSKSGVNWIRRKEQSILAAMARARSVLPTPGTSSIRTCPSASRATTASRITSGLPRTTSPTFSISRFERERSSSRSGNAGSIDLGRIHAVRSTYSSSSGHTLVIAMFQYKPCRNDSNGWMDARASTFLGALSLTENQGGPPSRRAARFMAGGAIKILILAGRLDGTTPVGP